MQEFYVKTGTHNGVVMASSAEKAALEFVDYCETVNEKTRFGKTVLVKGENSEDSFDTQTLRETLRAELEKPAYEPNMRVVGESLGSRILGLIQPLPENRMRLCSFG